MSSSSCKVCCYVLLQTVWIIRAETSLQDNRPSGRLTSKLFPLQITNVVAIYLLSISFQIELMYSRGMLTSVLFVLLTVLSAVFVIFWKDVCLIFLFKYIVHDI